MERRYGYKDPSYQRGDPSNSSRSAGAESMDRPLRAEILSSAQRRYEAAARELWLRSQAEAQAQVRALAQPREQLKVYAQQAYPSRLPRQDWPPSQSRPAIYPQAQVQAGPSRPPAYMSPPPAPRPPTYAPSPSPNTSNPILYRFRQVPTKKPSTRFESSKAHTEEDLQVEELKRRYYEQLSNQNYSQTRPYGELPRSRSTINYGVQMQYPQGSSSGAPIRTMADEYLDYYMPARRGPQSSLSYQRQHQEATFRQAERRTSEEQYRRQELDLELRAQRYSPEAPRRREVFELEPPVRRSSIEQPERIRIPQEDKEPLASQSRPSKAKLAFLLNPSGPENYRTSSSSKTLEDDIFAQRQELRSGEVLMRERGDSHQKASSSRSDLEWVDKVPSEQQGPRASASGVPAKRKCSPTPESSHRSEASDDDEAPRAKRRTFGRLPAEYEDNSDLGPEEEERDEVYEVRSSKSGGASSSRAASPPPRPDGEARTPRSTVRHHHQNNFAHSATGKSKDSETGTKDGFERQSTPTTPHDGNKKYYFRPRAKAVSR